MEGGDESDARDVARSWLNKLERDHSHDPDVLPTPGSASPAATPKCVHDYTCPICLELLLRPVVLSCDHRFCRGCWLRVLQSRDVRATANLTGSVACPLGRCEVRPVVPGVNQALAIEVASLLEVECTGRASAYSLPDEERAVTNVNAWAAAGCPLTRGGSGAR